MPFIVWANIDAREEEDGDKDVGQSDRTDTFTDYQVRIYGLCRTYIGGYTDAILW